MLARWLPFPFLPAPFIGCYRLLGPIASSAGLNKIHLGAFPIEATSYFPETIASMRSILFSPVMLAGGLFLLGVPVSNWRHVIVTAGGLIAVALAIHVHIARGAIDSGATSGSTRFSRRSPFSSWWPRTLAWRLSARRLAT